MKKYRDRWKHVWGRGNKRESLGSGWIDGHRNESFEEEYLIIVKEKRRLGLK
jgi:hypothetical protein